MYFISKDNKKEGPYTLEEVIAMRLTDDILVWKEGISWTNVTELPELTRVIIKTPPPIPVDIQNEKENEKKAHYYEAMKKAAGNIIGYSLLIGLAGAAIVAYYFNELSYTDEWPDKYHIFHGSEEKNNHLLSYWPFFVLYLLIFEIIALIIAGIKIASIKPEIENKEIAKMSKHNSKDGDEVSSNSLVYYVGRFIGSILGIFGLLFRKNKY